MKKMKFLSVLALGTMATQFTLQANANSVLDGTWYNSYCSQVTLNTDDNGNVAGVYTSHTGSTGSSNVIGQIKVGSKPTKVQDSVMGIPFSLGINWRLINAPITSADGSWHWTSTFSGQYHPAQTIVVPNQKSYTIPETLELLNGLIATATTPLNAKSPVMWPQTLRFHKEAPEYCNSITPPKPVSYQATAEDNISGSWEVNNESLSGVLNVEANLSTGKVVGTFTTDSQEVYNVSGLFDTIAPRVTKATVAQQSLTLSLKSNSTGEVLMFAGGVFYDNTDRMDIWFSRMKSTTWVYRFTQETLEKVTFFRESQ